MLKCYCLRATVVYEEDITAETEEEAYDKFIDSCPYEIQGDIECDTVYEDDRQDEVFDRMTGVLG